MELTIDVSIPYEFMNCAITYDNFLIGDTNNSKDWRQIKIPLPEGIWKIHHFNRTPNGNKIVTLTMDEKYILLTRIKKINKLKNKIHD